MQSLKLDNPFLHAMFLLTQSKTNMMEKYDQNADQIQDVSLEIGRPALLCEKFRKNPYFSISRAAAFRLS